LNVAINLCTMGGGGHCVPKHARVKTNPERA
jgi:hypothetical protein